MNDDLYVTDTARLRCAEGTFRVQNIYGDGNCMFRAISYILWQNEDEHRYLRSMVCFVFVCVILSGKLRKRSIYIAK